MTADQGLGGARTPVALENQGDGEAVADLDDLRPAMAALVDPEPMQFDLLAEKAETSNRERRARGRPAGSANKRNDELFLALERMGYKNPVVRLMEIVSADPYRMGLDAIDALKLQVRAAEVLLPYMLAKKPQEHQIRSEKLHVFVAGTLSPEVAAQIQQNQLVSLDEVVRDHDNPAHDEVIIEEDQGVDGADPADLKSSA